MSAVPRAGGANPGPQTPPRGRPGKFFRLRFEDPAAEDAFLASYRAEASHVVRWAVVLSAVLALALMWQDIELPALGQRATRIRLYLVTPLCLLTWRLLATERGTRQVEVLSAAFALLYTLLATAILLVYEPGPYGISGTAGAGIFLMIMLATFTLSYMRLRWALPTGLGVLVIYCTATYLWGQFQFRLFLSGHFANMLIALSVGALTCGMAETLRRRQFLTQRELNRERDRYQQLLYTLVPPSIAHRLEGGEFPIADAQAETAILFSDFVGFTALTAQISPRMLIALLNELFFEFDLAAERHGVEKIKTIGDGYMAACGPPTQAEQRTHAIVRFGLEIIDITARIAGRFGLPIAVRVGVHTGALIAGVIGKHRFTYDMWGESVNMASRMESTGVPNRVQVSEAAYRCLLDEFTFEARGQIDVKGVGPTPAYLLGQAAAHALPMVRARHVAP